MINELFDLNHTILKNYIEEFEFPWEMLKNLKSYITEIGKNLDKKIYTEISPDVWVARNAVIAPTAFIGAPCIIGENTEVRHCAFIRGSAVIGNNCVIGNSTEIKNSVIFDNCQIPHYNYVGDTIMGYKSHIGAGGITSNVKSDKTNITVTYKGKKYPTEIRKIGAIIGDFVEVGCNSVLCPGTIIGRNSNIYPLSMVRGYVENDSIYKNKNEIVKKENKNG